MKTLRPLINRTGDKFALPADGWIHLVPRGEYPIAVEDREFVQVVDDAALASMANRFAPEAGNVRVDFDHFSYDPAKSSEAAGWLDAVEVRTDGLWAKLRTSDIGETALVNGRFRFISPSWLPTDVQSLGKGRIRPLRIDSAGLTNNPNMRGMAPLTNRDAFNALPQSAANSPAGAQADIQNKPNMKLIAQRLGLSADASEEAILGELTKLTNRATSAEQERDGLKGQLDPLKNRVTELLAEQIDADLDAHGIKDDAKRTKLKPVLATMKNRADRVDFLAMLAPEEKAGAPVKQALTNRQPAKTPGAAPSAEEAETKAAEKRAAAITNRARAIRATDQSISLTAAYRMAEEEQEATETANS